MLKKILLSSFLLLSASILPAQELADERVSIPQITYLTVDFSQPQIHTHRDEEIEVDVHVGPGAFYNDYYKNSWVMCYPGASFIEIIYDNQFETEAAAALELCHLSSMVGNENYSPITIVINDQEVISNFSPNSNRDHYIIDRFQITEFLEKDINVIRICFDEGAISNYWIQSLKVKFDG